jgi:hypothetical protein
MEENPQAISDLEPVTASQPTSPKGPKKQNGGEKMVVVPTMK